MARNESDREDLIGEATALSRRVELSLAGEADSVVAGFRDSGDLSVYFGSDPVYHFDKSGRLRRAFLGGDLYRTQGTTLARLTRQRTPDSTALLRHDLESDELADFLSTMAARLKRLREAIVEETAVAIRQVPDNGDIAGELADRLQQILADEPRLAPAIAGKR